MKRSLVDWWLVLISTVTMFVIIEFTVLQMLPILFDYEVSNSWNWIWTAVIFVGSFLWSLIKTVRR